MTKTLITLCETMGMISGIGTPCLIHAYIGPEYVFPSVIGGIIIIYQSHKAAKTAKKEVDELNKKEL